MQFVVLAPASLDGLDVHPHGVAAAMRRVAAAGGDPLSLPDLRDRA